MDNALVLAYLGDSVYEVYIRKHLIDQKISKVNNLQKEAIKYVSAKGQCDLINKLIANSFLTEEELSVFYRARNHKTKTHPKNTDIITYKYATGFEAIIGFLYLDDQHTRLEELMQAAIEIIESEEI